LLELRKAGSADEVVKRNHTIPSVCTACCILDFLPYNATAFSLNALHDFATPVLSTCESSFTLFIKIL
jgi:hypothetical protein